MEWLKDLESYNISFHTHILEKQESIFIQRISKNNQIIYIVDGLIQLLQVFTNKEKICLNLLKKNQMITSGNIASKARNYYYILTSVTKTTIITVPLKEFKAKIGKNIKKLANITSWDYSIENQMIGILSHKNTKKRIIQLLMILIKEFGKIEEHKITIPFHLSHQTIANITGSQRITVSKIIGSLKEGKCIQYSGKKLIVCNAIKLIQGEK